MKHLTRHGLSRAKSITRNASSCGRLEACSRFVSNALTCPAAVAATQPRGMDVKKSTMSKRHTPSFRVGLPPRPLSHTVAFGTEFLCQTSKDQPRKSRLPLHVFGQPVSREDTQLNDQHGVEPGRRAQPAPSSSRHETARDGVNARGAVCRTAQAHAPTCRSELRRLGYRFRPSMRISTPIVTSQQISSPCR